MADLKRKGRHTSIYSLYLPPLLRDSARYLSSTPTHVLRANSRTRRTTHESTNRPPSEPLHTPERPNEPSAPPRVCARPSPPPTLLPTLFPSRPILRLRSSRARPRYSVCPAIRKPTSDRVDLLRPPCSLSLARTHRRKWFVAAARMGGSISKMMAKVFGSKEMRLLMLGLDAAGKTSTYFLSSSFFSFF